MDDQKNQEDLEQEPKKIPRVLWMLLGLVALAIIAVVTYQNSGGLDAVNRFFTYTIGDDSVVYQYDDGTQTQFGLLDDVLVTLTATKVEVQGYGGDLLFTDLCYMQNPSLKVGNNHAVAYDVGGDQYYVLDQNGLVYHGSIGTGNTLVSANLNAWDYLVLTHESSGYKTTTSVYNANHDLVYSFDSSSRFVADAYVSNDNTTLVAVALDADGSTFVSQLLYYPLIDTVLAYQCQVEDVLPLEMSQQDLSLLLLGDTKISFVSLTGTCTAEYDFDGDYLTTYDCSGADFTALLLNSHQAGNEGRLVTVDSDGNELASLEINEEVMHISVNNGYVAVLYGNSLVVYTAKLQAYHTVSNLDYATWVEMQSDGSVVVFGRERAQVIAP